MLCWKYNENINFALEIRMHSAPWKRLHLRMQSAMIKTQADDPRGTCLSHYGLTQKLRVGEVTNMYAIAEKQLQADLMIRP